MYRDHASEYIEEESTLWVACTVAFDPELVLACTVLEDDFCTHGVPVTCGCGERAKFGEDQIKPASICSVMS